MNLICGHKAIAPPTGATVWEVDPYAVEILAEPEPYYAELRAKGPFVYIPEFSILACGRYEATKEVFSDSERFVSSRGVGLHDLKLEESWRPPSIVLEADPPYHTGTRRAIMRGLSPKAVAGLKATFRAEADALVDRLLETGRFDAVPACAEAFPTTVFPAAIGLKENDPERLIDYGSMVFNGYGPDNELRRAALAKGPQIIPWITESCARANIRPDGLCAIFYEAADAGEVTEDEAGMLVRSLLSAGVDTTVASIGAALWLLARHPAEFDKLRADPKLTLPCFEEVLRCVSPVHSFCRTAAMDTEVAGVPIEEGSKILCALGAANLDEDQFENAARFDIERRPKGHLAFGVGVHNCVGQTVARAEMDAILSAFAAKAASIELTGDPVWRPNNAIRMLDSLPVEIRPR